MRLPCRYPDGSSPPSLPRLRGLVLDPIYQRNFHLDASLLQAFDDHFRAGIRMFRQVVTHQLSSGTTFHSRHRNRPFLLFIGNLKLLAPYSESLHGDFSQRRLPGREFPGFWPEMTDVPLQSPEPTWLKSTIGRQSHSLQFDIRPL